MKDKAKNDDKTIARATASSKKDKGMCSNGLLESFPVAKGKIRT